MPVSRLHIANILEEGTIGGPQRRSVAVAKELASRPGTSGADTTLVFPETAHALTELCASAGVDANPTRLHALSKHPAATAKYVLTFVPEIVRLALWLRRSKVDVVHVSTGSFGFKGPAAARLARVPYVWHLNDTMSDERSYSLVRRAFQAMSYLAPPACIILAAQAVGALYGPWLRKSIPTRVVPAPHRVGLLTLSRSDHPDPYPPTDGLRVLLMCNVSIIKGIDVAIESMKKLESSATLFVVGSCKPTQQALFDELKAQVSRDDLSVVFLGYHDDVAAHLAHADISLCTSRAEASPLSVWEAAAAGNALVSTDVGDVAYELPHNDAALIVPVEDTDEIARSIDLLCNDQELRNRLGTNARERMRGATSVERVADLSLDVYVGATDGKRLALQ